MSLFSDDQKAVTRSAEFLRILALPLRQPTTEWQQLSDILKKPGSSARLRDIQAQALFEAVENGGLFAPIDVGFGKTLITLLATWVMEARRPLLLLPAALIEKTKRDIDRYGRDWRIFIPRIYSYEMLGRVNAARMLDIYAPDLILADECHKLKNRKAGVTKRVERYMDTHPETQFVAVSGSICNKSIKDFAHIVAWTHKKNSPLPLQEHNVIEWSEALDEKVNAFSRRSPGALLGLAPEQDGDLLTQGRRAFNHRFVSTPGIVCASGSTGSESFNGSIYLSALDYTPSQVTEDNFERLRTLWETPDGWAYDSAPEIWRVARELALGLHYIWDPRPPDKWLETRRIWAKFIRDSLRGSDFLDTPLQVVNAVRCGEINDLGLYKAWREVEPSFTINSRPVWHDESALNVCAEWGEKNKGIIWAEHTFFAEELSKRTKFPYFGAKGLDRNGKFIEDASGPIIASIAANKEGRNIQQQWNKNLITSMPSSAIITQQLIGRTHRSLQPADEVIVDVLHGCFEHNDSFYKAQSASLMQKDLLGQQHKILIADINMPSPEEIMKRPGWRWKKNDGK